uniref:Uncharacterized protein n=1 Tax=Bactrocera dorsalis TaxID=27457 RepID=A0A034WIF5_BACDO
MRMLQVLQILENSDADFSSDDSNDDALWEPPNKQMDGSSESDCNETSSEDEILLPANQDPTVSHVNTSVSTRDEVWKSVGFVDSTPPQQTSQGNILVGTPIEYFQKFEMK